MNNNFKKFAAVTAISTLSMVIGYGVNMIVSDSAPRAVAQSSFSQCKTLAIGGSGYPRDLDGWHPIGAGGVNEEYVYAVVCR